MFPLCMQYYELMCILLYFSFFSPLTEKTVSSHFSSFKIINQYCQQNLFLNGMCFAFTRTNRIRNSLIFMLDARKGKLDGVDTSALSICLSLFSLLSLSQLRRLGISYAQRNCHAVYLQNCLLLSVEINWESSSLFIFL